VLLAAVTLGLLKDMGLTISIDDFGTGYSRARGCAAAQGYYFSRPLSAERMVEWLGERRR
jgi:EAL domain-containing protein (putative c-di-GMP-specific phosphodiesterase class I)